MPWEIKTRGEEKVVHLKASGSLDLDLIKEMCSAAMVAADEQKIRKYLVDFVEMDPQLSTIDIYKLPALLEAMGDSRKSRTAITIAPDSDKKKDFAFFETASLNQGFQVRLFFDVDSAAEWLGQ